MSWGHDMHKPIPLSSCSHSPSGIGAHFSALPGAVGPAALADASGLLSAALDIIFMVSDAPESRSPRAMYGAGVLVEMAKAIVDSHTAPSNTNNIKG